MSEHRLKEFDYQTTFDRLMREQFGEGFTTEWSILQGTWGGYQTTRDNGKRLTKAHALFGRGISQGIEAYRAWERK